MNTLSKFKRFSSAAVLVLASTCANAAGIVSFIWDDASRSHGGFVAPLFESKGVRAGFAIPAGKVQTDWQKGLTYPRMRQMQAAGHEFLAHGNLHINMASASTPVETVQSEVVGGLAILREQQLNVKAFVAPNSAMHPSFVDALVRGLFQRAFTVYDVSMENAVQRVPVDPHRLHRTSLYLVGLAGAKQLIDRAAAEDGLVVFYDHDPALVDYAKSMPSDQVTQVLNYALAKGVSVLPPSAAYNEAQRRYVARYAAFRALKR